VTQPGYSRQLLRALRDWWQEQSRQRGAASAGVALARETWGYLRDSTPERRRSRYGDMEYDWEHRVDTTSGSVGWRERLLGVFHSAYQPTDAESFREMMAALPINFSDFTFIDIGSGKGRTLLMASEYSFRRIIGVEILPGLHQTAVDNITTFRSSRPRVHVESICMDAAEYVFPLEPLVVYLFNPLPEADLRRMLKRLEESVAQRPRQIWVVYHNPLLEKVVEASKIMERATRMPLYAIYRTRGHHSVIRGSGT
jgi:hypothetical protein